MHKTLKKIYKHPKYQLPLLLSLAILFTGLMAGVLLSLSPQDIRQQAATNSTTITLDLPITPPNPNDNANSIDDDAVIGDINTATVAIIEFGDYQCPFCHTFATETLPQIIQNFVNTGQAIYVYRDFPLRDLHPLAYVQAEAAECAGDSGDANYYQFHDQIIAQGGNLDFNQLVQLAVNLGYDNYTFSSCLGNHTHQNEVYYDLEHALSLGATGTPFFLIGTLNPDGTVDGQTLAGAQPFTQFQTIIQSYLDTNPSPSPSPTASPSIPPTSTNACTAADFNSDQVVNDQDRRFLIDNFYYYSQNPQTDLNADGTTDLTDYSIFVNYFGQNCAQ